MPPVRRRCGRRSPTKRAAAPSVDRPKRSRLEPRARNLTPSVYPRSRLARRPSDANQRPPAIITHSLWLGSEPARPCAHGCARQGGAQSSEGASRPGRLSRGACPPGERSSDLSERRRTGEAQSQHYGAGPHSDRVGTRHRGPDEEIAREAATQAETMPEDATSSAHQLVEDRAITCMTFRPIRIRPTPLISEASPVRATKFKDRAPAAPRASKRSPPRCEASEQG